MLKVITTEEETISIEDLTDDHFIVIEFKESKGVIMKINGGKYVITNITENSNNATGAIYDSIEEIINDSATHNTYATLDYQEFKNYFYNN